MCRLILIKTPLASPSKNLLTNREGQINCNRQYFDKQFPSHHESADEYSMAVVCKTDVSSIKEKPLP